MANSVKSCLTVDMLDRIGDNEVSPAELSSIEEHVSNCARCREQFDNVYAAQQWRDGIRPALLQPPSFDLSPPEDNSEDHDEILSLLGPTDDPHMLGRIGSYEVAGIIGRGGMGVVFKAFDVALDRFVAIKILSPHLASSGAARKRFVREGKAAAAVVDDHVLPVYGVDQWRGIPYLVMQYSRGVSLQQRLSEQGPQELNDILRIGSQIAHGLSAAHAQGLVHRDVKPSNMLLDATVERVMLTDFGLARAIDDASVTRTGVIAGTPQYMSPEQVRGESIDARSDLFGLGCVLYAMCTGHSPFRSESSYAVLRRITDDTPRRIRETNPDIPEWLEKIVMTLLAKSPDDRFESAEQVAELLQGCLAHVQQPTNTPLPKSVAASASNRKGRPPIGTFVTAAAFAFSLMFAGVLIVLELNKGTLKIESEVDDIAIRILRGDKEVDKMTVTQSGDSMRVAAGNYVVAIAGESDGLTVENGQVTLKRGEIEVVRIVRADKPVDVSTVMPKPRDRTYSVDENSIRDGGKIVVDIYCGDDVMPQMNTDGANRQRHVKLLQALNALPDVVTNFRVAGRGNEIFEAIVRVPEGIEKQANVLAAIKTAMTSASVPRFHVRYLVGAKVAPGDVLQTLDEAEIPDESKGSSVKRQPPLAEQQTNLDVETSKSQTGRNHPPAPKSVTSEIKAEQETGRIEGYVLPLQLPQVSIEAMKAMAESVNAMSEEQKAKLPKFLREPATVPQQPPATDFQFVKSVKLYSGNSPIVKDEAEVSDEGKFVFEDVPSGSITLSPQLRGTDKFTVSLAALNVPTHVRTGETTKVTYFGAGVPVIGKVALPANINPENARIGLYLEAPPMRSLSGRNGKPSPTSAAYYRVKMHVMESTVDADGNFRIDGVREGNYRLFVSARDDDDKSIQLTFKEVVSGYPYVYYGKMTIPLMEDGKSDKPINIGTLKFDRRIE